MALDRFVYWRDVRPTTTEIHVVLEDYVAGLATEIQTEVQLDHDRVFVTLPGVPSFPLARCGPTTESARTEARERAVEDDGSQRRRWFEVFLGVDYVDVITRQMDPITNDIARDHVDVVDDEKED